LLGDGNGASASGQIAKDLDVILARKEASLDKQAIVELLYLLPQGSRTAFDKKTHRRVWQRTTRLSYTFLAAQLLSGMEVDEVTNLVLAHLEGAQAAFQSAWGESIWSRLAGARWDDLNSVMQSRLQVLLSEEKRQALQKLPISNLESDDIGIVKSEAGRQALAHVYRRLLLGVITDLWVEYLTQMEALRVSIGLEAYAQRDPLVQYKSKASELFAELLSNMRLEMVMRMFTYRLRDASALPVGLRGSDEEREEIEGQTGQLEVQSAGALPEAKEEQAPALPDIEPTQEEENDTAVELSRSQKRRRRRH
jgi:preprotein translocase subunit SecA